MKLLSMKRYKARKQIERANMAIQAELIMTPATVHCVQVDPALAEYMGAMEDPAVTYQDMFEADYFPEGVLSTKVEIIRDI